MSQILTRIGLLMLPAVTLFLLALPPAFGQQKARLGAEVLPGEEMHWYARHITKSYRDARKAKADIAELKDMGLTNAQTRLRPWYVDNESAMDSELVIGPFATEREAEDVQIFIYRRTKELYQTMHMPWSLGTTPKAEVHLVSVGTYISKDDAIEKEMELIDIGFFPNRMGVFADNGVFYWKVLASGYKLKSNAEKIAKRLQANGFKDAVVLTINWDTIQRMEDNRVAYQSKSMGSSSPSSTSDYSARYRRWESCVARSGGATYSSTQVGSSYFKCGDAPTP